MTDAQTIATAAGIANAPAIVAASALSGLDLAACLALIEMESGGKNIYGHDLGGVFSVPGKEVEVTEVNYTEFIRRVLAGETSNGVGPCQITYAGTVKNGRRDGGHFALMTARGLKPWDPTDSCRYGFEVMASYRTRWGTWSSAGAHYNGGTNPTARGIAYGQRFAALVTKWTALLASSEGDTMLTDLAAACRKSGLNVVEVPGWQTRGRPPSTGGFSPRGILCHHTGDKSNGRAYADWLAKVGRSDLPAPLAQLSLDRQGTVYVLAAGRANHAGKTNGAGFTVPGDGNAQMLGIEAQNNGSEGWSSVQYDAYVALCAALCDHYGWPRGNVLAHRETSVTGKWDPGLIDMNKFRSAIAAHNLTSKPTPERTWFDMATNADLSKIVDDRIAAATPAVVAAVQAAPMGTHNGKPVSFGTRVRWTDERTQRLEEKLDKLIAALDAAGK